MIATTVLPLCMGLASSLEQSAAAVEIREFDPERQSEVAAILEAGDAESVERLLREAPDWLALGLEARILSGHSGSVLELLEGDAFGPDGALGGHAACLRQAASTSPWIVAEGSTRAPDPLASYSAHVREVQSLRAAGLHVSARLHALNGLDILADGNLPDVLLSECTAALAESWAMPMMFLRGAYHSRLGEAQAAVFHHEGSLQNRLIAADLLERYPTSGWHAFSQDQLGWAWLSENQVGASRVAFERALAAARCNDDRDRETRVLRCFAYVANKLGEEAPALNWINEALAVARASDLPIRVLEGYCFRAGLHSRAGRARAARSDLKAGELAARGLLSRFPHHEYVLRRAQVQLQHAVRSDGRLTPDLVEACTDLSPRLEAAFERSLLISWLVDHYLATGETETARHWVNAYAQIVGDAPSRLPGMEGRLRSLCGDHRGAMESFKRAIRVRDESRTALAGLPFERRFSYQAGTRAFFRHAILAAARAYEETGHAGYAFCALYFIDHGRVRSLRDLVDEKRCLTEYPWALEGVEGWQDAFEANFALAEHEILLALDCDAEVAVAVRQGQIRLYRTPPPEKMERQLQLLRHTLVDEPSAERYARVAARVGQQLLHPIEDWLQGSGDIICLSDTPLMEFPLEFLLLQSPQVRAPEVSVVERTSRRGLSDRRTEAQLEFADLPFLFRSWTVAYPAWMPRIAADPGQPRFDSVLAVAHSNASEPLVGARREAHLIQALFGGARVEMLAGERATEEQFKSLAHPVADILHLATHVVPDRLRGGDSYIALGASAGADGCLEGRELTELDLAYELVLVAGCEGTAGQRLAAEGQISICWSLLASGAQRVVASPMRVEDHLSPLWIEAFYRELRATGMPREALRRARIELCSSADPDARRAGLLPYQLWYVPR